MSTLSQFGGGMSTPIGGVITVPDGPVNFTHNGAEFLRLGAIKTYDSSYADSIAAAPALRVFGTDAKVYGTVTGSSAWKYAHVGGNYMGVSTGYLEQNGASLSSLSGGGGYNWWQANKRLAASSSYVVVPRNTANTPAAYTTNGTLTSDVGGVWSTCPIKTASCYGNNSWLMLSSLNALGGEQAYINNANPTGSWTVGASTDVDMTAVLALAYGGGVFLAVGTDSSIARMATCASVGSAWTARESGISWYSGEVPVDVVFDGTVFVLYTNMGRCFTSSNGSTWTFKGVPLDVGYPRFYGTNSGNNGVTPVYPYYVELCTNGAGTTVFMSLGSDSGSNLTDRPIFAVTTDNANTFVVAQPYIGKLFRIGATGPGVRSLSYANGHWVFNLSGDASALLDITSFATPDYIGMQWPTLVGITGKLYVDVGTYVRIK